MSPQKPKLLQQTPRSLGFIRSSWWKFVLTRSSQKHSFRRSVVHFWLQFFPDCNFFPTRFLTKNPYIEHWTLTIDHWTLNSELGYSSILFKQKPQQPFYFGWDDVSAAVSSCFALWASSPSKPASRHQSLQDSTKTKAKTRFVPNRKTILKKQSKLKRRRFLK